MYLAMRQHFTRKTYDYVKFHGKVKTSQEAYDKRHDQTLFKMLSRKKFLKEIMIYSFFKNKNTYLTDMVAPDIEDKALAFWKNGTSPYYFKRELQKFVSLDEAFTVKKGQYPKIYEAYKKGEVSPQTLIICDDLAKVFDYWTRSLNDKFVWPDERFRLDKLKSFMDFDRDKYKKVLLEAV